MVEALPEKHFDFLTEQQIQSFDVTQIADDASEGYFVECDLEYPDDLHTEHSDYPLCPQNVNVEWSELSPYSVQIAQKLNIKPSKCRKLISNLKSKQRYSLHYRALKLYVELGMKIIKIHRVLSFTQSKWLKPFIDFNTEQRKKATTELERDLPKLVNNGTYGKTMVSTIIESV